MSDRLTDTRSKLNTLPIFKNVDLAKVNLNPIEWRPGEKPTFNITSMLVLAGLGFVAWKFLLPLLIGIFNVAIVIIQMVFAVVFIATLYALRKPLFQLWKKFIRKCHEAVIRNDIWGTFETQREKLVEQQNEVIKSDAVITSVENQMMTAAQQAEKDAESYKTQLFNIEKELDDLFTEKAKFNTPESKELDEYSDIVIKINDLASESDRIRLMYDQAKTLVLSFGSKANIFKKFRMQFKFYLSAVKNRVKDFDATVKMLKVDFDATSAMSSGTDAVKNALLFSDQWEVAYATDLVQNAVAYNIANTSSNIVDIKDIMGSIGANTNPEQAFEKLKLLTGNIERGIDIIPQAKRYANPELKLNSEEKKASGFGEGVF